jgi:hypothetical protein
VEQHGDELLKTGNGLGRLDDLLRDLVARALRQSFAVLCHFQFSVSD